MPENKESRRLEAQLDWYQKKFAEYEAVLYGQHESRIVRFAKKIDRLLVRFKR